jgi:hypothetical protein
VENFERLLFADRRRIVEAWDRTEYQDSLVAAKSEIKIDLLDKLCKLVDELHASGHQEPCVTIAVTL